MNKKYIAIFLPIIAGLCLSQTDMKTIHWGTYIVFAVLCILFIAFSHNRFSLKYLSLCFGAIAVSLWIVRFSQTYVSKVQLMNDCDSITGTVLYDSSFSENGNNVITVKLESNRNSFGNEQSAKGLITVVSKIDVVIPAFVKVSASGNITDGLFIAKEIKVVKKSNIIFFRENLMSAVRNRISNSSESFSLSLQLITGYADDNSSLIKQEAEQCGCLHVLALSGMHLQVLSGICQFFFRKKLKWPATFIIIGLFVFVAGPRPSLIRAALMVFLFFLPKSERFYITFIIQAVIFPYHLVNLGCIYAYTCVYALLFIAPYLSFPFKLRLGSIGQIFGSSVCVCLINAPLQIIINGKWYVASIVAGPMAGALVSASMSIGLMHLAFPNMAVLQALNDFVYKFLLKLFSAAGRLSGFSWKGYLVFASFLIICFCSLRIEEKTIKKYH